MPRHNKSLAHKPFSFYISCLNKQQYRNENEAQKAAEFHMLEHMGLELSVYKCDSCKYWHLTRQQK